jgi:hypothetical protein
MKEYKEISMNVKLGGLGADLNTDELVQKRAKAEKMKDYAAKQRSTNAAKVRPSLQNRPIVEEEKKLPSRMDAAKEYAKAHVPKPKVARRNPLPHEDGFLDQADSGVMNSGEGYHPTVGGQGFRSQKRAGKPNTSRISLMQPGGSSSSGLVAVPSPGDTYDPSDAGSSSSFRHPDDECLEDGAAEQPVSALAALQMKHENDKAKAEMIRRQVRK